MPNVLSENRSGLRRGRLRLAGRCDFTGRGGRCRRQLGAYEAETGRSAVETIHIKGHLYFRVGLAARAPSPPARRDRGSRGARPLHHGVAVLDQDPQDHKFVSWHQDHRLFRVKPPTIITAWLALNGGHPPQRLHARSRARTAPALTNMETYDQNNLLSRGQAG